MPEGVANPAELTEHRGPAGRYASTVHVGPYDRLGDTWSRLMREWIPAHDLRIKDGQSYEVYLNNPEQVAPDQLRTEVNVPVA